MILLSEITKISVYSSEIQELYKFLPKERQGRIKNRIQSILLSYWLLLFDCVIRKENILKEKDFVFHELKKTYYCSYNYIMFNIGHCNLCIAVTLSISSIGIYFLYIFQDYESILHNVYSGREIDDIKKSKAINNSAYRHRSPKENCLKFLGCGVTDNNNEINFSKTGNDFTHLSCYFKVFKKSEYIIYIYSSEMIETESVSVIISQMLEVLRKYTNHNLERYYYLKRRVRNEE